MSFYFSDDVVEERVYIIENFDFGGTLESCNNVQTRELVDDDFYW